MAALVFLDAYLSIAGVDQSDYVKSVTLNVEVDTQDSTTMGDSWRENTPGLKSGTLEVEWLDDFADGLIDDDLWALIGTNVAFEVRPTSSAVGTSNPKYTGTVTIKDHSVGGAVGELGMKKSSWPTSGTVTRAEA